jgi:hypothetical protein
MGEFPRCCPSTPSALVPRTSLIPLQQLVLLIGKAKRATDCLWDEHQAEADKAVTAAGKIVVAVS